MGPNNVSLHNKSIFGTLGIVAVILGIAIAVWIFHRKRITKHRRRHAALLAIRGADPPTR
jgi:hypothetical protein